MKKKLLIKIGCGLLAGALLSGALSACRKEKEGTPANPEYLQKMDAFSIWSNSGETSVPQYQIYHHVHDFLDGCTIENGTAVSPEGKTRKVLFLGFDGMRADAAAAVFSQKNEFSGLDSASLPFSGIRMLSRQGGIYLGYCGGEQNANTQQTTSTSASWTSQFTGVWGNKHGIKTNEDTKNMEYKTFLLEYAEQGLDTALAFDWDQYLDVNLKEEVKYVMENPQLPLKFCDIDRVKKEKLKKTNAETLELYNFVAPETPSPSAPYDAGMRDWVLAQIEDGGDVVCGIFHNIDTAGHTYEFSMANAHYMNAVNTCDRYAYEILQVVLEREKQFNEEWLIVFANDHGGINQGHGEQTLEERTTWIATNRLLDKTYYSVGYDGYTWKNGAK